MAADILGVILRPNLAAAAAILIVLILRRPLARFAGARASYALWAVVPLAALASLLPGAAPVPIVVDVPALPDIVWRSAPVPADAPGFDISLILVALWLAGAVIALTYVTLRHGSLLRSLGQMVRRPDGVLQSQASAIGPAVLGAWRPRIIVPADFEARFKPGEQAMILAHETVHLRGGDAQINALIVLCQCLCWFNPIVHIAAFHVRLDQELACDAAVLARYPEARRSYAEALLKTQMASSSLPLGCSWPARSAHPLKERLAMLKLTQPSVAHRFAGAAAIALLATSVSYSAWAAKTADPVALVPALIADAFAPVAVETPVAAVQDAFTAPQPRPARVPPQAAPTTEDVCLTNACAAPAGSNASAATAPQSAPVTPGLRPFAERFDGSMPLLLKGKVTEARRDNGELTLMLVSGDKTYRVVGGAADRLPQAFYDAVATSEIVVRGYGGWDTSCDGGCLMNGRDITFVDGRKVFLGGTGTGAPRDGTDAAER